MAYSMVTSKGQVTIPKTVRDRMGIEEGTRLVFIDDGDRILVYKIDNDLASAFGAVRHEGPPIDFKRLREKIAAEIAKDAIRDSLEVEDKPEKTPVEPKDTRAIKTRKAAAKKAKPQQIRKAKRTS